MSDSHTAEQKLLRNSCEMDDIMKKPFSVPSTILASLCYCYFISLKTPKGFLRLITLLPILYHFTVLPLYLSPGFFLVLETASFVWHSGIRLWLFAFGKGPLSQIQASQSLYSFIVHAALPLRNPSSKQPRQYPSKKRLFVAIAFIFMVIKMELGCPPVLFYFMFMLIYLDIIRNSLNHALFHSLLGLDLEPAYKEPDKSTSLQDFWGRRWNLTVSHLVKQAVYDPVRSASGALLGNELARAVATMATFLASGLVHELLVHCFTLAEPSWEMTSFFVLHGICLVLEVRFKKSLKPRIDFPWYVSIPLTWGFGFLTYVWLFFPPLIRTGLYGTVTQELQNFTHRLNSILSCTSALNNLS